MDRNNYEFKYWLHCTYINNLVVHHDSIIKNQSETLFMKITPPNSFFLSVCQNHIIYIHIMSQLPSTVVQFSAMAICSPLRFSKAKLCEIKAPLRKLSGQRHRKKLQMNKSFLCVTSCLRTPNPRAGGCDLFASRPMVGGYGALATVCAKPCIKSARFGSSQKCS